VWLYDFARSVEMRVAPVSTRAGSEIGPSYDRGWLAYGRQREGLHVRPPGARRGRRIDDRWADATAIDAPRLVGFSYGARLRRTSFSGRRSDLLDESWEAVDSYGYIGKPSVGAGALFWPTIRVSPEQPLDGLQLWRNCLRSTSRLFRTQASRPLVGDDAGRLMPDYPDAASDGTRVVYMASDGMWVAGHPVATFRPPRCRVMGALRGIAVPLKRRGREP
jgi:hypothetical protein